jgi:hypothetical protein
VRKSVKSIFIVSVIAVVVAAVIGGFVLIGSPTQEGMRRIDARRVADLRAVASAVDLYWTRHGSLPPSLDELSRGPGVSPKILDPETGQPYEYGALSGNTYQLCTHFAHDTAEEQDILSKDFWSHGPGRQCFRIEVKAIER